MKKILISMLLTCILLTACFSALAEAAFTVTPNPPESINYSRKYNVALFRGNADIAFLDKFNFNLSATTEDAGGDVYVALDDLQKMYAPDFTVTVDGDAISVSHVGLTAVISADKAEATIDGNAYTFKNAPKTVDGVVMVPVVELMSVAFAKETQVIANGNGDYYAIQYTNGTAINTSVFGRDMLMFDDMIAGMKNYGFRYLTYTIEDDPDQKVLPVRLYIPTTYDPATPSKAILVLHGNSVNMDYFFADTATAIQYKRSIESYAEEFGYILIVPTAYLVGGSYGDVDNIPTATTNVWTELTEEEKELRIRSEKSALTALELIQSQYNIDEEHIYLMGNSMGGMGTLFLGNKYYEKWDAIAPCGGISNLILAEEMGIELYPNLTDMPLLFVEGTEDQYGMELTKMNFDVLAKNCNNAQFYAAPGGVHNTGWCVGLPQIFAFFNANN